MSVLKPLLFPRVLVVEDERDLRESVVTYLNMDGMDAHGVDSVRAAEQWMQSHTLDVLLLDLGLPDVDGLRWLERRTGVWDEGLIITSARADSASRLAATKLGADGYLVKPIVLEELSLCIVNLARRLRGRQAPHKTWVLHSTSWQLDAPNGQRLKLTHSETALLTCLAKSPGVGLGREGLIAALGHNPQSYDPRRMEILVRRLRTKAKSELGSQLPVATVHGVGYALTTHIDVVSD